MTITEGWEGTLKLVGAYIHLPAVVKTRIGVRVGSDRAGGTALSIPLFCVNCPGSRRWQDLQRADLRRCCRRRRSRLAMME